jgi:hypothetical protein
MRYLPARNLHIGVVVASLAVLLSACSTDQDSYPSLAPRPIEQRSDEVVSPPPAALVPDPALDARITKARAALADAAQSFDGGIASTTTLVAAAAKAGVGSDPWLDAQTALAELDGARARSAATLSDVDAMAIARAAALKPAYPALDALDALAQTQVAQETATIAGLQKRLPAG